MKFESFSPKQLSAMLWWSLPEYKDHDAIVCDGSVRSGKTMAMSIGFVMWSMKTFDNETFAFCGKTIDSLKRNVITPLQKWLGGIIQPKINLSKNYMDISWLGHQNRYYFFGGKDESSYALIQGMTLAGVLLDEVALMPKSFVDQAVARCSVSGSRMWFNCNPDGSEEHWFYKDWIDDVNGNADKKNRLHLHFTMKDNYALSDAVRERYERLYTGAFYERYILGLWRAVEGIVYPMFSREHHVIPDKVPSIGEGEYYLSCDYGTLNPTAIGLWHLSPHGYAIKVREYYYDARKKGMSRTDEEHYAQLEKLAGKLAPFVRAVIVDPSAASFIETIRRHAKFRVWHADNSVLDGIRDTATLLELGRLRFCACCEDTIREFGLYRWDEKNSKDAPIKENDHAMDETRYFVRTAMKRTLKQIARELEVSAV
ncbi:MAG: PBSX family phage terminase large subunit [Ruminococcus sp.]|nr:PBSX family phage terminase large subunit [Ruminococcus sp.]